MIDFFLGGLLVIMYLCRDAAEIGEVIAGAGRAVAGTDRAVVGAGRGTGRAVVGGAGRTIVVAGAAVASVERTSVNQHFLYEWRLTIPTVCMVMGGERHMVGYII
tara:strand:- start:1612 stop:1926 length:315 start_codon:yes stop_codon:yes gene_type:complete